MCSVYDIRNGLWYSEMCASRKPYICRLSSGTALPEGIQSTCDAQATAPNCEPGWTYFSKTSKCYKVMDGNGTWPIHESKCNLVGAHLTSVLSSDENNFVKGLNSQGKNMPACADNYCPAAVWIGLYKDANAIDFSWSDGSTLLYRRWAPQRPHWDVYSQRTYCCLYVDSMVTVSNQQGTEGYDGKWDHYPPDNIAQVRAGVCKRDY